MNLRRSGAILSKVGASFSMSSLIPFFARAASGMGRPGWIMEWNRPSSFPETRRIAPTSTTRSSSGRRPVVSTSITTNGDVFGSNMAGHPIGGAGNSPEETPAVEKSSAMAYNPSTRGEVNRRAESRRFDKRRRVVQRHGGARGALRRRLRHLARSVGYARRLHRHHPPFPGLLRPDHHAPAHRPH